MKLPKDGLVDLHKWSNITNSRLLQNYDEKSDGKSKTDVQKMFDERLTSFCPIIFAKDTPIEMACEEATTIEIMQSNLSIDIPKRTVKGKKFLRSSS